jgi:hypothetical protein
MLQCKYSSITRFLSIFWYLVLPFQWYINAKMGKFKIAMAQIIIEYEHLNQLKIT